MSRAAKATTTSFAILGLLAIRSWTTYELTQQMQRSLSRFWPRAESKLYEEPRKLAARGWATAAPSHTGRRLGTRYTITPEGRQALARWLREPAAGPVLEFEALLKVFLAEHGTKDDVLTTLIGIGKWARERAGEDARIARTYLDGNGQFPERAAELALVGRYLADFADMTERWAHWATEVVEQWPDDPAAWVPAWEALEEVAGRAGST